MSYTFRGDLSEILESLVYSDRCLVDDNHRLKGMTPQFDYKYDQATNAIIEAVEKLIGKDEKLKDVKNRSILDAPKVKKQNIYRVGRNELRQHLREALRGKS